MTPHIRVDIKVFARSDSTGMEGAATAACVTPTEGDVLFTEEKVTEVTAAAIATMNGLGAIKDFRPMTADEVDDYIRRSLLADMSMKNEPSSQEDDEAETEEE